MPVFFTMGVTMRAALQLFEALEITYTPSNEARRRGPRSTCCGNIVEKLIRSRGLEHATIVLRTVAESEGNEGELIADIIRAISGIVRVHPRWVGLGLRWLEAFDQINLAAIRKAAKASGAAPLHSAIMVLLCVELEKILGPSKLPKPSRPSKADVVRDRLALGTALIGPDVTAACERYNVDPAMLTAQRAVAVAKLYGDRPEITSRVSWSTLCELSRPSLPRDLRRKFEAAIISGQTVRAPQIERARRAHAHRRQADRPGAPHMAA